MSGKWRVTQILKKREFAEISPEEHKTLEWFILAASKAKDRSGFEIRLDRLPNAEEFRVWRS